MLVQSTGQCTVSFTVTILMLDNCIVLKGDEEKKNQTSETGWTPSPVWSKNISWEASPSHERITQKRRLEIYLSLKLGFGLLYCQSFDWLLNNILGCTWTCASCMEDKDIYTLSMCMISSIPALTTTTALVKEENMFKSFSLKSTTRDPDRKCNTEKAWNKRTIFKTKH